MKAAAIMASALLLASSAALAAAGPAISPAPSLGAGLAHAQTPPPARQSLVAGRGKKKVRMQAFFGSCAERFLDS